VLFCSRRLHSSLFRRVWNCLRMAFWLIIRDLFACSPNNFACVCLSGWRLCPRALPSPSSIRKQFEGARQFESQSKLRKRESRKKALKASWNVLRMHSEMQKKHTQSSSIKMFPLSFMLFFVASFSFLYFPYFFQSCFNNQSFLSFRTDSFKQKRNLMNHYFESSPQAWGCLFNIAETTIAEINSCSRTFKSLSSPLRLSRLRMRFE